MMKEEPANDTKNWVDSGKRIGLNTKCPGLLIPSNTRCLPDEPLRYVLHIERAEQDRAHNSYKSLLVPIVHRDDTCDWDACLHHIRNLV